MQQYLKTIFPIFPVPTQHLFPFHIAPSPPFPRLKLGLSHTVITSTLPCVLGSLGEETSWMPGGSLVLSLFGQKGLNPKLNASVMCHQSLLVCVTQYRCIWNSFTPYPEDLVKKVKIY